MLSLLVVAGADPSLLGRDWLHKIKLNWGTLNHMPVEGNLTLDKIISNHAPVF